MRFVREIERHLPCRSSTTVEMLGGTFDIHSVPDRGAIDHRDPAGGMTWLSGFSCGGRTSVVLLTMHKEENLIVAALRAGIRGYIVKTQGGAELIQAVREAAAGETYLCRGVCGIVVSAFLGGKEIKADPLNTREREVLQLVAEGRTTKEIATILEVTVKSAESYRTRLMEKLNIHGTATLVRYAIRHGLIQP